MLLDNVMSVRRIASLKASCMLILRTTAIFCYSHCTISNNYFIACARGLLLKLITKNKIAFLRGRVQCLLFLWACFRPYDWQTPTFFKMIERESRNYATRSSAMLLMLHTYRFGDHINFFLLRNS